MAVGRKEEEEEEEEKEKENGPCIRLPAVG